MFEIDEYCQVSHADGAIHADDRCFYGGHFIHAAHHAILRGHDPVPFATADEDEELDTFLTEPW